MINVLMQVNETYIPHKHLSSVFMQRALANAHKYMFSFGMFALCTNVWHVALDLTLILFDSISFFPFITHFPAMSGSSEGSVDSLCDLCEGLHGALAEADLLGRRCKRRSAILRTLFRFIDLNSAQLNLCIAQLCLAVSPLCPPDLYTITRALWEMWKYRMFLLLYFSPAVCQWKQPA